MIRSLLSHSLVYGATSIAVRGTTLVSLLIFPYILAPRDYGALAMLTVVSSLAIVAVPLQVTQGLARYWAAAPSPADAALYASSAWWFTLFAQGLFLIVGQYVAIWATEVILGDTGYVDVLRLALFVTVLNSLVFFLQSQFRWEFRAGDFVGISLVYSILTLTLSIGLGFAADEPLRGVVLGQLLAGAAAVVWGAWRLRASLLHRIDRLKLVEMLRFATPLVPGMIFVYLTIYASRIVLNDEGDLADVAIFTFGSQVAMIGMLTILGVQAALTPLIAVHHQEPGTPAALARVFHAFCAGAFIVCLGLGLFAPEAIAWLGHPDYAGAAPLVLILAPAFILGEMYIFAPGFWVSKRTDLQMWVSLAAAALAFALSYLLIGRFGILGAALATLASALLFILLWFGISQRLYPVPIRWPAVALYAVAAGAAGAAGLLLTTPGSLPALAVKIAILVGTGLAAVAVGLVPLHDLATLAKDLAGGRALRPSGESR